MIHTDDFAFIHFMKTGGMSLTRYLVNVADGPVHAFSEPKSHPQTHAMATAPDSAAKLTCLSGPRHANVARAVDLIHENGLTMPPWAFVMIRHPVDLMLSLYKHLQKPHVWTHRGMTRDTLRGQVKVAMENDFADFARQSRFYALDDDGAAAFFDPSGFDRLDVVPLQRINEYLALRFGQCRNFADVSLSHQNQSHGGQRPDDIDPDTRAHICKTYPQLLATYESASAAQWQA